MKIQQANQNVQCKTCSIENIQELNLSKLNGKQLSTNAHPVQT